MQADFRFQSLRVFRRHLAGGDADDAALREFAGIGDQVLQHLPDPHVIETRLSTGEINKMRAEPGLRGLGLKREGVDRFTDRRGHIDDLVVFLTGHGRFMAQRISDQRLHCPRGVLQMTGKIGGLAAGYRLHFYHSSITDNLVERRPQFIGNMAKEAFTGQCRRRRFSHIAHHGAQPDRRAIAIIFDPTLCTNQARGLVPAADNAQFEIEILAGIDRALEVLNHDRPIIRLIDIKMRGHLGAIGLFVQAQQAIHFPGPDNLTAGQIDRPVTEAGQFRGALQTFLLHLHHPRMSAPDPCARASSVAT